MTLFYPDVSNVNWGADQDPGVVTGFLDGLIPEGFAGVAHKVTQGSGFKDWAWPVAKQWCDEHHFPVIGYHYIDLSNPTGQATNYRANGGTHNVMLDWENGGGNLNAFWNVVDAFNDLGYNVQLGYCPRWYLESAGAGAGTDISDFASNGIKIVSSAYPLGYEQDLASNLYNRGGGDTGEGWEPYDGGMPSAWQFTSSAQVAGLVVDTNAYLGTSITDLFGV